MSGRLNQILRNTRIGDLPLQTDHRIEPSTTLGEVYQAFDELRHGAAIICRGSEVAGIFTERDILYRTAVENLDPSTPVETLMSVRPVTARTDQLLADALAAMVDGGYRHIPVVDDSGQQVGLLSSRVILKFIADHFPEAVLNLPPNLDQVASRSEGG